MVFKKENFRFLMRLSNRSIRLSTTHQTPCAWIYCLLIWIYALCTCGFSDMVCILQRVTGCTLNTGKSMIRAQEPNGSNSAFPLEFDLITAPTKSNNSLLQLTILDETQETRA